MAIEYVTGKAGITRLIALSFVCRNPNPPAAANAVNSDRNPSLLWATNYVAGTNSDPIKHRRDFWRNQDPNYFRGRHRVQNWFLRNLTHGSQGRLSQGVRHAEVGYEGLNQIREINMCFLPNPFPVPNTHHKHAVIHFNSFLYQIPHKT